MIPYQKEKTDNAICYFAKKYKKHARKNMPQTTLYKLLSFLDLESIKNIGMPALGLKYKAMKNGPVPSDLYNNKPETELYKFVNTEGKNYEVICKGKPDMDYFSAYEIEAMERLILIYADSHINTKHISEASHETLPAWKKAHDRCENSLMDFEEMFDGPLTKKDPDKLSQQEERFMIQKALLEHK